MTALNITYRSNEDSELALVNRIADRISNAAPLPGILNDVAEFAADLLNCSSCIIYVLNGEDLVLQASKNPPLGAVERLKIRAAQAGTGWTPEQREPIVVKSAAYKDTRFKLFNELLEDRFESFLSVPVVSGGRLVGVVNLQDRVQRDYSEYKIGLIATLGFLLGTEIERVRLENENSLLSEKLRKRTAVERAKSILQHNLKISEEDAYRTIQMESQERRKSMEQIAEAIILANQVRMPIATSKL